MKSPVTLWELRAHRSSLAKRVAGLTGKVHWNKTFTRDRKSRPDTETGPIVPRETIGRGLVLLFQCLLLFRDGAAPEEGDG
jgi:hypothetical protein